MVSSPISTKDTFAHGDDCHDDEVEIDLDGCVGSRESNLKLMLISRFQ
jgi:hypothetical protein